MTRFSARWAGLLGALLAVAAIGITYGRLAPRQDECPSQTALLDASAIHPKLVPILDGDKPTRLERGRLLGIIPGPGDGYGSFVVAIDRGFGLSNRLIAPASAMPGRHEPDDLREKILDSPTGPLPVRYAYERRGRRTRVTAYFMTYRGRPIESPLWTRIREGPTSLIRGSWPITLFAVSSRGHPAVLDERLERMDAWLLRVWEHYQGVCGPAERPARDPAR